MSMIVHSLTVLVGKWLICLKCQFDFVCLVVFGFFSMGNCNLIGGSRSKLLFWDFYTSGEMVYLMDKLNCTRGVIDSGDS